MMILNLNTIMTGKSGPVVPKYKPTADFIGVPTTLNQNNTVNYTDQSTVDPLGPPITSWAWTFEGGNPATSTTQNPTNILYATPGTYDVTLTATNADGSGTTTKVDYITVNQYTPPFTINSWNIGPYQLNVGEYQNTDWTVGTYGINVELASEPTDPDAEAFITATGITDSTQQSAINQLVLDLKSANIWSKMQAVYPFVGGTATTHKYNLVDPQDTDAAYRLDFNNIIHSAAGATGNGAGCYADTHWIPNQQDFTNGVHWSANISAEGSPSEYNMGIAQSGDWALINDFGTNNLDYWQASFGGYMTATTASGTGFTLGTSNGSDARALYVDGVLANSDSAGTIGNSQSISAHLFNVNGSSNQSNDTSDFVTIGEYLTSTEVTSLYNAMTTFNSTLGR